MLQKYVTKCVTRHAIEESFFILGGTNFIAQKSKKTQFYDIGIRWAKFQYMAILEKHHPTHKY